MTTRKPADGEDGADGAKNTPGDRAPGDRAPGDRAPGDRAPGDRASGGGGSASVGDAILRFSPRVTCLPVVHGSGDFALEARRWLLDERFDCVAVPLPPSFQASVEEAIGGLPSPAIVVQREPSSFDAGESSDRRTLNYVPIDPCQPVIAALRWAIEERVAREFIDRETAHFEAYSAVLPDAYAVKRTTAARFAAAVLPTLPRPEPGSQPDLRIRHMAGRLRQLERRYRSVLCVCSLLDWPWLREAFVERRPVDEEEDTVEEVERFGVEPRNLLFLLGELPFITGLYERARSELEDDTNLSIDGVKELLLSAREAYQTEFKGRARRIGPHLLRQCLKYVRNLSLIDRRLTPDLYSLVVAARQTAGDQYALRVAEIAGTYPFAEDNQGPRLSLGVGQAQLPDGKVFDTVNRLAGPPMEWRSCELQRRPEKNEQKNWRMAWNPFEQCSWPPEDERIESFRAHVFDRARAILGADLAKTEKFTTSIQDGIDIRETMRHWHDGGLYVKVLPPSRARLDCVVMLFDSPADPREYSWRSTWFAEHPEESTLAFFATNFREQAIGPGICVATYGGAMFLFPPLYIPDIWSDRRLDFTDTLEERLIAAACLHARESHVALMSGLPPGAGLRRLAKRFGKRLVHVPLGQFSDSTIQQLRLLHVLNGKHVRSYAAHFIRKA
jgi:hypothetical protein